MKKLITALFICVFFLSTSAYATSALLMGFPTSIEFNGPDISKISDVVVEVKKGWLNSPGFELEITITGLNGGVRNHGTQRVALDSVDLFDEYRDVAQVFVPWIDMDTNHNNEVYTVCIQVLSAGQPLGGVICEEFLPF